MRMSAPASHAFSLTSTATKYGKEEMRNKGKDKMYKLRECHLLFFPPGKATLHGTAKAAVQLSQEVIPTKLSRPFQEPNEEMLVRVVHCELTVSATRVGDPLPNPSKEDEHPCFQDVLLKRQRVGEYKYRRARVGWV